VNNLGVVATEMEMDVNKILKQLLICMKKVPI
jgi:hypothetical protein